MKNKKIISIGMVLLVVLMLSFVSAVYSQTNPNYGLFNRYVGNSGIDAYKCEPGQDFIVQIAPFGCTPAVVRSDLLEEQNVPVFCQLAATKINPLIGVEAIESIAFSGGGSSQYVSAVDFHPARAALGVQGNINSPVMDNIGYVVIVLKEQVNESSMPDYVTGNLTAKLRYDIKNAFGIGTSSFYLPVMSEGDWNQKKNQYSFWNGRGYVRADNVYTNGATISLYDGTRKISSVNLEKGKTSGDINIPGFDCRATMNVRLDDLAKPGTRVQLMINGETVEVIKGEKFLENRCWVNDIKEEGLNQRVKIYCKEDETGSFFGSSREFDLIIAPKIKLNFDGAKVEGYGVGDFLYENKDKFVYLGYIGNSKSSNKLEDVYVYLVAIPEKRGNNRLTDGEVASIASLAKNLEYEEKRTGSPILHIGKEVIKGYFGIGTYMFKWFKDGQSIERMAPNKDYNLWDKKITFSGYASAVDKPLGDSFQEETYTINWGSHDLNFLLGTSTAFASVLKNGGATGLRLVNDDAIGKWKIGESCMLKTQNTDSSESIVTGIIKCDKLYGEFKKKEGDTNWTYFDADKIDDDKQSSAYKTFFSNVQEIKLNEAKTLMVLKRRVSAVDTVSENYLDAMDDFNNLIDSYPGEKCTATTECGEEALYEKILLAEKLEQKKAMLGFCERFKSSNSGSEHYKELYNGGMGKCERLAQISSSENSIRDVSIDGQVKTINFIGIYEPSFKELGATINVRGPNKLVKPIYLSNNEFYYLNDFRIEEDLNEFVQIVDIKDDSVTIGYNIKPDSIAGQAWKATGISSNQKELKIDTPVNIEGYIFTLADINLEKFAKVSIVPKISDAGTSANFSYKIAIEKRAIQLSPEQTKKKIADLNESIEKWSKLSGNLGQIVSGLKGACISVKAVLTVKNFLNNAVGTGDGMARREVMNMPGGWKQICNEAVRTGKLDGKSVNYKSLDACYIGESNNIDRDVGAYNSLLRSQSDALSKLQTDNNCEKEGGFLETNYIDTDCVRRNLFPNVKTSLNSLNSLPDPNGKGQAVNLDTVRSAFTFDKDNYSAVGVEDARQIQMDLNIINSGSVSSELQEAARKRLYTKLSEVESVARDSVVRSTFESELSGKIDNVHAVSVVLKDVVTIPYRNSVSKGDYGGGAVQPIVFEHKRYVLGLKEVGRGDYEISKVYDVSGKEVDEKIAEGIRKNIHVKGFDGNSYKNYYKNPEVKYYETEPHKGLPAVVPFDCAEGWYVYTKQSTGAVGGLKTYDDSGALRNYYICNVGPNGLEEGMGGDDVAYCRMINKGTGQPYDLFPGLSESQAKTLVMNAERAVMQVARAYKPGVRGNIANVGNCGNRVKVGDPAAIIPAIQCQDTMSPKECQLLFNVCDPVVCPSSRCNAGGTYTVSNVIQSGIIGSLALCLPNFVGFGGDVYVPVCLSGLKAGLDGLISVQKSYRDCLQENLDTGKMVGICDEVYSIYLCDFLWRQGLPLAKTIIPKVLEIIMGKNTRGGGEYLFIQDAWNTASTSMSEFVEYYAANSFNAFKARTTEEMGSEVCKNFASGVVPSGGSFLDALTQPDVPSQFYGRFDEIPFTDATVPPVSHYKVFYHIFAGNDSGVYYKVFLKGAEGSSFYQDTGFTQTVDSGYINQGETVSETIDFTGTAGYKEMCIRVNNQEECGFKQVSTSYAVNYVNDQYVAQQASAKNINSEEDCIQGTASGYSLLSPNLQGGADELVNQGIYNRGIIRICSGSNPGLGTDGKAMQNGSRWVDVGQCGNINIRCWLDTNSVTNVIKGTDVEGKVLSEQNAQYLEKLQSASGVSVSEIDGVIKKLGTMKPRERIVEINKFISKSYMTNQKAMLLYWRGKSYSNLAGEIDAEAEKQRLALKTQKEIDTLKNAEAESLDELGRPQSPTGSDEEQNLGVQIGSCQTFCSNDGAEFLETSFEDECYYFVQELESAGEIIEGVGYNNNLKCCCYKVVGGGVSGVNDRKSESEMLENSFGDRSAVSLAIVMTSLKTKSFSGDDRQCKCGNDCATYAEWIVDASKSNGIPDPLLLLSVMMQENNCQADDESGGSVGLMQLTRGTVEEVCFPTISFGEVSGTTSLNKKNNIQCGAKILKSKYKDNYIFRKYIKGEVTSCSRTVDTQYYGWEAALRGYSGWGCAPGHDDYVEQVVNRYFKLVDEV